MGCSEDRDDVVMKSRSGWYASLGGAVLTSHPLGAAGSTLQIQSFTTASPPVTDRCRSSVLQYEDIAQAADLKR